MGRSLPVGMHYAREWQRVAVCWMGGVLNNPPISVDYSAPHNGVTMRERIGSISLWGQKQDIKTLIIALYTGWYGVVRYSFVVLFIKVPAPPHYVKECAGWLANRHTPKKKCGAEVTMGQVGW
ncbi:MAG: hypothetical protein E4H27_05935 [Anaerolineales bacterium]|nr:MAG: hypothetical protein E4H27_05935 [Anaerolineales bacterium]